MKSWKHQTKSFLSYIDLKKAYNSVPRNVIQLVRSFHSDMKVSEGDLLDDTNVENGLRLRCCTCIVCAIPLQLPQPWRSPFLEIGTSMAFT